MHVDRITAELIEDCLRTLRQGGQPPKELLELDLLNQGVASHFERSLLLYESLESLTLQQLSYFRKLMGIHAGQEKPATKSELYRTIRQDFEAQSMHLDEWSALYYRYFEPDFLLSVDDLAKAAGTDLSTFRRRVRNGIDALTKEVRKWESKTHQHHHARQLVSDPEIVEHSRPFGIAEQVARIEALLRDTEGPRFVSVEGIGGIGKTALVREMASRMATSYSEGWLAFLWVSAKQEEFNARGQLISRSDAAKSLNDVLTQITTKLGYFHWNPLPIEQKLSNLGPILRTQPYLIFIDNLETLEESTLLVEHLPQLAGETRFVLTSRETLHHFPYIHTESVAELSFANSELLIRSELSRLNPRRKLTSEETKLIYEIVGGIPLALKLVTSQLRELPLQEVMSDLKSSNLAEQNEAMFRYIYRRTWGLLDKASQLLLLAMYDIDPDGAGLDYLQMLGTSSGLSINEFRLALKQLHDHSLLESAGLSENMRYKLHRLTITFLQTDIIDAKWNESSEGQS